MLILTDKKQLIHALSGCKETFSKSFLLEIKKEYKKWCPFANHGPIVDKNCYVLHQHEVGWIKYLKYFIFTIKYFHDDSDDIKHLSVLIDNMADPNSNSTTEDFEKNLDKLISLVQKIESLISLKLEKITCFECERLGEAITCLESKCFAASTVMSASAIESRLHYLIRKKDGKIYKQYFQHTPLGGLIKLFDKDEYKNQKFSRLKKIVPDKHKPLLDLINTYRIFSAHPSKQEIDFRIAEILINLSILFLLDSDLKISKKKLFKK